jgi:hypothetical protein
VFVDQQFGRPFVRGYLKMPQLQKQRKEKIISTHLFHSIIHFSGPLKQDVGLSAADQYLI